MTVLVILGYFILYLEIIVTYMIVLHFPKPLPLKKWSCRSKTIKFVGREIFHKWIVGEKKKKKKWYSFR